MTAGDWVNVVIAAITAVAAGAAWFAAASARDSAKQTRVATLIEVQSRRLAALQGLYGLILTMAPGDVVEGLYGRLNAVGYPLIKCTNLAGAMDMGRPVQRSDIGAAQDELERAIRDVNQEIERFEGELAGRPKKLTW